MVEQMFDNMRKATQAALETQEQFFRQWTGAWAGGNASAAGPKEQAKVFQKKWADACLETFKKQWKTLDNQFEAGLKVLEEAFKSGEIKTPEEFYTRLVAYWQKSFDSLRQFTESQVEAFQAALAQWVDVTMPSA